MRVYGTVWPHRDLVTDEDTALIIGTAHLRAYFGDAVFEKWRPYEATRMADEWFVCGTNVELEEQKKEVEQQHPGSIFIYKGGGMPGVSFTTHDARVTSIHYQR